MHLNDGSTSIPECVVMLPANEANELDTVLILGEVGGGPPLVGGGPSLIGDRPPRVGGGPPLVGDGMRCKR